MDKEFEKQLEDFYQGYRDRANWPLCDGIRVDDLARDTAKFFKKFKSVQFTNTKDEQIKRRIAIYEKQFIEQTNENYELKQQLAEKEKEFNWLHQKFAKFVESNQDKISFAVERIKNLKSLILNSWRKNYCNLFLDDIEEIIDNQVEQLKKEMIKSE